MKAKSFFIIIMLSLCCIAILAGCTPTEDNYDDLTKVVFHLEGGVYQNCDRAVVQYYRFAEGTTNYIKDLAHLSEKPIEKSNYDLEGWYLTKTEVDGVVEYSDKWDFDHDKVTNEGVQLYARWVAKIAYTYTVCYMDGDNEVVLGNYVVEQGDKFVDYLKYGNKRIGYTNLGFLDSNGQEWDDDYQHPGGEQSLDIKIYCNHIQGVFSLVGTKAELLQNKNRAIYLTADIDMQGDSINFGNYAREFYGNGHTISNAVINYGSGRYDLLQDHEDDSKNSLYISLFGNSNNAVIKDVNFVNLTVDINTSYTGIYKIYLAPIGSSVTNSTISNVSIDMKYTISKLPNSLTVDDVVVGSQVYVVIDDDSKVSDCEYTVTQQQVMEEQ